MLMVKERIHKDVVIIGSGMAGLTAALYAGRMNLSVLVLENAIVGGDGHRKLSGLHESHGPGFD